MNCPYCHEPLHDVKIESHYDATIILNQCAKCGGIWFDKLELFSSKRGEAEEIDKLDEKKLGENTQLESNELYCPRDNTKLKLFQDPYFPKSIQVESCPTCGGFWFNRGEFAQFQEEREKRIAKPKEADKLEQNIDSLLRSESEQDKYNALGRLGNFLMTPIYPASTGDYYDKDSQKASAAAGIVTQVIGFLLRAIIRSITR